MTSEEKARAGPELEAGSFSITAEHELKPGESGLQATLSKDEVGATSADVAHGLGAGSDREGAGITDVGAARRQAADPALQRGEQRKPQA